MAVLRCPYCGKTISEGSQYCSHCGKEIDKPVVDQYWSGRQEGASIVFKAFGFIVLWILVGVVVNAFIGSANHWIVIITATAITVVMWLVLKKLF